MGAAAQRAAEARGRLKLELVGIWEQEGGLEALARRHLRNVPPPDLGVIGTEYRMTTLQDITCATDLARAKRKALASQRDEDGRGAKRRRLDLELELETKRKNAELDLDISQRGLETKRKNAELDLQTKRKNLEQLVSHTRFRLLKLNSTKCVVRLRAVYRGVRRLAIGVRYCVYQRFVESEK